MSDIFKNPPKLKIKVGQFFISQDKRSNHKIKINSPGNMRVFKVIAINKATENFYDDEDYAIVQSNKGKVSKILVRSLQEKKRYRLISEEE